jgi:hypothetical protein
VLPATLLVNAMEERLPVQMVCNEGMAVVTGVGLTVTNIDAELAKLQLPL